MGELLIEEELKIRKKFLTEVEMRLSILNLPSKSNLKQKEENKERPSLTSLEWTLQRRGVSPAYASECIAFIIALNRTQMDELTNKHAISKIDRYKADKGEYITRHIYGAVRSFCRKKLRRWQRVEAAKQSGQVLSERSNRASRGFSSFDKGSVDEAKLNLKSSSDIEKKQIALEQSLSLWKEKLKVLFEECNISEDSILCFQNRMSGMSFPDMMRKYQPENFSKDPRGQKYHKRFYRTLEKLKAATNSRFEPNKFNKFLKEQRHLDKLARKTKLV